jgi:lipopolysaccharide export LptBFGC system permease protein LptF
MDKVNTSRTGLGTERDKIISSMSKHWDPIAQGVLKLAKERGEEEFHQANKATQEDTLLFAGINRAIWRKATETAYRKVSRLYQSLRVSDSRISSHKESINRYLVEVHKKFSIPFASIVFVLIGAPLGIAARKGSLGVGATLSILFFLIYWACLILGEDLADRRLLTPLLAMWFPNLLIGAAGFYLTWRTVKESKMIKWDKILDLWKKIKNKDA